MPARRQFLKERIFRQNLANFWSSSPELIDLEDGIYGITIIKQNSVKYFYFSNKLKKEQLDSKARKVIRQIEETREIQESIDKNKKLPKKFRINNVLVDVIYSFQTKLVELNKQQPQRNIDVTFHLWTFVVQ